MKTKLLLIPLVLLVSLFFIFERNNNNYSKFLKSEFKKIQSFDKPDISGFRDFLMTQDPDLERVPTERLQQAFHSKKMMLSAKSINTINWEETPSSMGGRARDIMYDPTDVTHKKVWAASVTGGVWYNTDISDENSEWVAVSDQWSSMATTNICYDPNNTSTFYVGTGEAETAIHIYRESSGIGAGIWRTTDAGGTWAQMPSTTNFAYISDIEVRNEGGLSVMYVGVMSGEYKGGTFQATPSDGLYRSIDDGDTWTQVLPNIDGETVPFAPSDIEIADNGTIYIGTVKNLNGDGGACILSSTTGLANSWSVNTDYRDAIIADTEYQIPGRVELSASKSTPSTVYAIIGGGSSTELVEGFGTEIGKYIVKTTNSGANWSNINMPDDVDGRNWAYLSWHAFAIEVNPINVNEVFIGGLDMYKTSNGGIDWHKISNWAAMYSGGGDDYVHGDIHKIAFNPSNNTEFSVVTDGGVFYTTSSDAYQPVFLQRNNLFNTFQFYTCGVNYTNSADVYTGGLQDNGTYIYMDHPYTFNDMLQGGDGAYTMWDKIDLGTIITSTYDNSMMVFYDDGSGGYNYTQINDYTCGTFISPFDYDSDDKVIYSNAITFNNDYPDQIFKVTGLPTTHNDEFVDVNTGTATPFSAVRFTKTSSNIHTLLVGNYTGDIFRINHINSTPNSTQIDNGQLPEAYVSSIQTGENADTILVTFSNYGVESVWQTFNGGNAWTNISGNLPDMPIRWAIYHSQNKKQIMLATETGIWTTNNAHASPVVWEPQNNTFPNVRVDMLSIRPSDNFVVAATHGRSMFKATWDLMIVSEIEKISKSTLSNKLNIFPNPAIDIINIEFENENIYKIEVTSLKGQMLITEKAYSNKKGEINISSLQKGKYIVTAYGLNGCKRSSVFVKK